ncbi:MAG: thiamine phosphate synthase [Bacteroidales bacterium]|jgi:thiamine-phosphate pyrophosphorylase|nr:thiamine phosphate synthase [Bacteroidales bacterium]
MKLIVVSTETFFPHEVEALCALFNAGLQTFHVRKPYSTIDEMRSFLQEIPTKFLDRMVLHDHFLLVNEFGLKGVHCNRRNLFPPHSSPQRRESLHISKSCHSLAEVLNASCYCNYVFLSPIFDSISKHGYTKAFSHEALLLAQQEGIINEKVIALGGITVENKEQVAEYGFGGIAIVGALWRDFEKTGDVQRLLQRFQKFVHE